MRTDDAAETPEQRVERLQLQEELLAEIRRNGIATWGAKGDVAAVAKALYAKGWRRTGTAHG